MRKGAIVETVVILTFLGAVLAGAMLTECSHRRREDANKKSMVRFGSVEAYEKAYPYKPLEETLVIATLTHQQTSRGDVGYIGGFSVSSSQVIFVNRTKNIIDSYPVRYLMILEEDVINHGG